MKELGKDLKEIYHNERWMFALLVLNIILATILLVFSITRLNPGSSIVKVGYGDIGGYRDGTWADRLAFPILAIIFGVMHSFIGLKIFNKRGAGMTKFFLIVTMALIIGTFIVLIRLSEEG